MAQRMLIIAPTESSSLWTTIREVVAPVLAMITSPAGHYENWTEAGSSDLGAGIASAPQSQQPLERMSGTTLTYGISEIVNKHVRNNPGKRFKRIFKFTANRVDEDLDGRFNTLIQTLSCSNPTSSMKSLTQAIENGFGVELDAVRVTVDGNVLEMSYYGEPLFKVEMKVAEPYMKYAVFVARNRWLLILHRQLRSKTASTKRRANLGRLLIHGRFGLEELADKNAERRIKCALSFLGEPRLDVRRRKFSNEELSTDWVKQLTGELIQIWLEASIKTSRWDEPCPPLKMAFKCSGSSAEDITIEKLAGERQSLSTVYASIIQDYICSQLRDHTSSDGHEPAVIIRMTNKRDDTFLGGPFSNEPYIQPTGDAAGKWISISDADGSGTGRTYLCQPSNFYAVLSDFLG